MFSRKFFLFVGFLFILLFSNQYTPVGALQTSSVQVKHDEIYRTLTVTIVNATIYDDRCAGTVITPCPGSIEFSVFIENNMYKDPTIYSVETDNGPVTNVINYTVTQNITLSTNLIKLEVNDTGAGTLNNPDYLGYVNITNLAGGTVTKWYNTTGAIGGIPTAQASLLVNTTVVNHKFLIPPVISLNSNESIFYKVDTTGHFLNFSIYDDNPNFYSLARNGELLYSGGWRNNRTILVNIDNLAMGNYNYTITAVDLYSAATVVTVHVSVTTTGTESANPSNTQGTGTNTNRKLDYAGLDVLALSMVLPAIIVLKRRKK